MHLDWHIKQNDNVKPLTVTLAGSESLAGKVVRLYVRNSAGTLVWNVLMTIVDAVLRIVRYTPTAADTATAGIFQAEVEVQDGAARDTYPEDGYIRIIIGDDIN